MKTLEKTRDEEKIIKKLNTLNKKYDSMQKTYGDPKLSAIYSGGCFVNPDICLVFMNPTGTNHASKPGWEGIKAPWIGTKNIWKLLSQIGVVSKKTNEEIQKLKTKDWKCDIASSLYEEVAKNKCYITNLGKCTQIDARPLPDLVLSNYLELLEKEISIINPKIIFTFGNQVSSIFLGEKISISKVRKRCFNKTIGKNTYKVYPVFYPVGNGMRNMDYVIEDINEIIKNITRKEK